MEEFTPQQIDALKRILERFTVDANRYLKTNFQDHPEAKLNPHLVSEYVTDMSVAANVYSVLNPYQTLYAAAGLRGQGLSQATSSQSRPSEGPGDEIDLLQAIEHNRRIIASSATERTGKGLLGQADSDPDSPVGV
jgi:hypothetical protein